MATDTNRAKQLFFAAADIADAEARAAYLDQECAGNTALRARVEALLQAHTEPDELLDAPVPCSSTIDYAPITEKPGSLIGPYKLKEQIGEGGFGLVFVAEQTEPVKRKVALKIIKPGMDTRQVVARFEAERQALALMDHPNIARVLDAGATDTGRPYFVMELVRGNPITEYCDQNQLPPKDRLELFVTVCQAIQHAHQKGIIHRDIKPSNVLVTSHDGKPVAKVIDFGVAKAIHQSLSARTIYTNFAQMIGTPLYMSPEQAEMSGLDIDTRSDIYSLGVLLYELLTGSTPIDKKRFAEAAFDEIRRMIREDEPQKPSTRLSTSESIASVAAQRHMEPAKLSKFMRGDLDWITMKALEKDRTRRYETANGLARDIQRYLNDEPVEACPPSVTYRLRKFAKKNRAALTTTAAITLLLIAGIAVSTWQAVRANRAAEGERLARVEAQEQRESALQSAAREAGERKKAEAKEAEANAVVKFFEDHVFSAGRPKGEAGRLGHGVSLHDAIKASLPALASRFRDQPLVEARLRMTLGITFGYLGDYSQSAAQFELARALFTRHLGPDHPDTLQSTNGLAISYTALNRQAEALTLREETLAAYKRVFPPDHPDTLKSMNNLALSYTALNRQAEALTLREETLAALKRVLPPDHPDTLKSMNNLANSYWKLNRHAEALKLYEEALAAQKRVLPPDHPDTLLSMNNLANSYAALNRQAEAIKLYEEALAARKRVLPPDHPDTLKSMHNLANCYQALNRQAEALNLREEVLAAQKRVLPPDHPDTLLSMNNLAISYAALNRQGEAIKLYEEALAAQKRVLPPDHPNTLSSMNNLANSYAALNRQAEALNLREEVLAARKRVLPPDHPDTLLSMNNLAISYAALNRQGEAIKLYEEALAAQKRVLPPDHPNTLSSMNNLANSYAALNRQAEALNLREEVLAARKRVLPPDHPDTLLSMNNLAISYAALNRQAEALNLREEVLAAQKRVLPPDYPNTLRSMYNLANSYAALNRQAEALNLREEVLAARKRVLPPDYPNTLRSMYNLANSYAALNRQAEALNLREEVLAAQKRVLPPDHPAITATIYNIACTHALMIPKADDKSKQAEVVMDWLKQAVAAGFKNVARIKKNKDLDALRERDDFKKLIAELEAKAAGEKKVGEPQKP